jgi:hypothetical protein
VAACHRMELREEVRAVLDHRLPPEADVRGPDPADGVPRVHEGQNRTGTGEDHRVSVAQPSTIDTFALASAFTCSHALPLRKTFVGWVGSS